MRLTDFEGVEAALESGGGRGAVACCETTGSPDGGNGDSRPMDPTGQHSAAPCAGGICSRRLENRSRTRHLRQDRASKTEIAVKQRAETVRTGTKRLPGMDSNHELDKILEARNLLILQNR